MFLKLTGRGCQNQATLQNFKRVLREEKIAGKNVCYLKERSFDLLSFEGKCINFGASKQKLRQFEIRRFCDKMRPFCTISASTFWKIHPDIHTHIHVIIHIYIHTHTHTHKHTHTDIHTLT